MHELDPVTDLFDGLVIDGLEIGKRIGRFTFKEVPDAIEKLPHALNPIRIPRHGLVKRPHEHFVDAKHIRAVCFDDVIRIDHVPLGFRHLLSALGEDEPVRTTLGIRLRPAFLRHNAEIPQELVPEARIQQVKRRVLHAAVIQIDRHPVLELLRIGERLVIVRIAIAQEVPARARPVGHGVGFTLRITAAIGTLHLDPLADVRKRRFALVIRLIRFHDRERHGQLIFRDRDLPALGAVDDRDRLAPIPLARKYPVAQLVRRRALAESLLLQPRNHVLFCLPRGQAIQKIRSDVVPFPDKRLRQHGTGRFRIMRTNDHPDRQLEFCRECEIAFVMRGHGHDRARAVGREHII